MVDMNNIKLGYSPLSDSIYIYRHGKDSKLALDKREATSDVHAVIVEYMMHGTEKGAAQKVSFKPGEWFEITVKKCDSPEGEETHD